jgi:hypothetical protein
MVYSTEKGKDMDRNEVWGILWTLVATVCSCGVMYKNLEAHQWSFVLAGFVAFMLSLYYFRRHERTCHASRIKEPKLNSEKEFNWHL